MSIPSLIHCFDYIPTGDSTQPLVANCIYSEDYAPTITITITPANRTLVMMAHTADGKEELSFLYNTVSIV